jgi:hypothetical protein
MCLCYYFGFIFGFDNSLKYVNYNSEYTMPFEVITNHIDNTALLSNSKDIISPQKRVYDNNIKLFNDQIIIEKENITLAKFSDTNSMDPLLDSNTIGIMIPVKSLKDIHIGDIVSYYSFEKNLTIAHRVIDIGEDNLGWYAIFKGDNNLFKDSQKVRFNQIRKIMIGILY